MMQKQKGFSPVHVLLVMVVIAIITGTGWYVWKAQTNTDEALSKTGNSSIPKPSKKDDADDKRTSVKQTEWATFKNVEAGLMFQYPVSWKSIVNEPLRSEAGRFGGISGELISPSRKKLAWLYSIFGGKGGGEDDCDCKREILSAEASGAKTNASFNKPGYLLNDVLYITRTKYSSTAGDSYQVCLDAYYDGTDPRIAADTPKVGDVLNGFKCKEGNVGFNATFAVPDEAGFTSDDAKMAERIMKTFVSL